MILNPQIIVLILCYAPLQSSADLGGLVTSSMSTIEPANETEQFRRSTALELTWTPGVVKKSVKVGGDTVTYRVINGTFAKEGEIPYQISLRKRPRNMEWYVNFCGAVIITPKELLSAAHCFRKSNVFDSCCKNSGRAEEDRVRDVFAVAGTLTSIAHYKEEDSSEGGQWRALRTALYPRDFRFPKHDIAVVFLKKPLIWTNLVKPIPYASKRKEYQGSCLASGYGRIEGDKVVELWAERGSQPPSCMIVSEVAKFRKGEMRIISTWTCNHIHESDMSKFVCTSDEFSDVGKGDSGGPIVCKNTGDPNEDPELGILVGIVSGSRLHVSDGAFFTRVSSFHPFIQEKLKNTGPEIPELYFAAIVAVGLQVII